jgi:hypothetical protein
MRVWKEVNSDQKGGWQRNLIADESLERGAFKPGRRLTEEERRGLWKRSKSLGT